MNPVNGFTSEGLPLFLLSNMPVQSTAPSLSVTRPEIYFGELTNTDVYVKTHQQEFDYPQGQGNNFTSYQGTGGIVLGGFLRRILISIDRGDLGKLPFSDDVTPQSRLLMRRNIRDRVAALAPFLTFDQDPYLVVGDTGRLSWIIDAYTTSDSYPYSTHYSSATTPSTTSATASRPSSTPTTARPPSTSSTHPTPSSPPIARIFPSLFKDACADARGPPPPRPLSRRHLHAASAGLRPLPHDQPRGLLQPRRPLDRRHRERHRRRRQPGRHAHEAQLRPHEAPRRTPTEEFVEILPFTPANRNNLIGWIAGRSDGAHYGTAVVYDFPKTRLVDGPQQIEARIDQNAQLSGQLTLWNQQGSHVLRGSLLVIPTGKALLYAEPIYLQAQQSPMPELRLVVLALQDSLAYGPTFESALASLFGGELSSLTASEAPPARRPIAHLPQPNQPAADLNALIAEASQDFADYQRLTAAGKLAEAGQKLDALKHVIDQLNAHPK